MIKDEQIIRHFIRMLKIDLFEAFSYLCERWRSQARPREDSAQWIDVATVGNSAEQRSFDRRRFRPGAPRPLASSFFL